MESEDVSDHLEDLEAAISDLTPLLTPILTTPLKAQTATLPLLDRAKLHILHAYAIESLLFSALLTAGIDPKTHPIYPELSRLKTYFGKVKDAEQIVRGPGMKLDKGAAARFIRAGLAGNEKVDKERRERVAREKARAKLVAARGPGTKTRFGSDGEEDVVQVQTIPSSAFSTEAKGGESEAQDAQEPADLGIGIASHHKKRKHAPQDSSDPAPPQTREERKAARRAEKAARKIEKAHGFPPHKPEERLVPKKDDSEPKTYSETFKALLEGPLPKRLKAGKGGKRGK